VVLAVVSGTPGGALIPMTFSFRHIRIPVRLGM